MDPYHVPVLLQTACDYLNIKKNRWYLDATLGGGGHTAEILRRGGKVIGLDQDEDAIRHCLKKFSEPIASGRLKIVHSAFSHLDEILKSLDITTVNGVLFDLGVSLHQLATPERGFSFQANGPLDMRMNQNLSQTAQSLINLLTPKQLNQIFKDFGQIQNGFHLAEKICTQKPATTQELVKLIPDSNLIRPLFQSLRIAVNAELFELETALPKAYHHLEPNGRLVVIAFHSLEDRIVKHFDFGTCLTKTPITPSKTEIKTNPSAKSAKLRVFVKKYEK